MSKFRLLLLLGILLSAACSQPRETTITLNAKYIAELAGEADKISALHKTDAPAAKQQAIVLNQKMCAYVAGLEDAGTAPESIQELIGKYGERLGAAFALMAE